MEIFKQQIWTKGFGEEGHFSSGLFLDLFSLDNPFLGPYWFNPFLGGLLGGLLATTLIRPYGFWYSYPLYFFYPPYLYYPYFLY